MSQLVSLNDLKALIMTPLSPGDFIIVSLVSVEVDFL